MDGHIVELINVTQANSWLPWAVLYFFLIGLSYAGFFLSMPAFVFGRSQFERIARVSLVVALTCGIAAPIALVSDLHHPDRFYNFYLHFTPGSWMSWGTFFLSTYLVGLVIYAWLVYRPGLAAQAQNQGGIAAAVFKALGGPAMPQAVKFIGLITAIAAVLVVIYTGAEMAIVKTRLLWHGPFMPLLFLTTALAGAGGLALVLSNIYSHAGDNRDIQVGLSRFMLVTLGLTALLTIIWLLSGMAGVLVSGEAVMRLATEYNPLSFWLLWAVLGTIAPLVLIKSRPATAGALAVFGAWIFRWSMFIDGQRIPKTGAGFFPYDIPWGSEGMLSLMGTFALWVLLVMIVTTFLPWRGSASATGKAPH